MRLKENWRRSTLGELCSIEIGGTPSRSNVDFWDADKVTSNIWVSIKDLNTGCVTSTAEQISDLGVRNSNVKLQSEGTVLLSFKLSIGRVARAGKPLYTNEAIAGLRSEQLRHDFLYQGLQYWDLLKGVDQAIKGATLNKSKLRDIEIYYPIRKSEQSKIAEVLTTVDQAIEQTEALIAKQQRIKTGLMQDLLTRGIDEHGNLRSEETHEFKDSPLGRIPVEWDVKPISGFSDFVTSGARGWAQFYSETGDLFIRIGNLTREHINMDFKQVVYVKPPSSIEGTRTSVIEGDVLVSVTADLGIVAVVPRGFGTAYVNQHIALIRINPGIANPRFTGWSLQSRHGQSQIEALDESGAKSGLNLPTVRSILIPLPTTIREQEEIAARLDSCVEAIKCSQANKEKLLRVKAGLMQDLLTGDVPVTPLLELADTA